MLYFIFGDVAFPHDAKTNLSVYNKSDEYYSIESILYLWRNREMTHTTYVKDASGKGIQPITRPQRYVCCALEILLENLQNACKK